MMIERNDCNYSKIVYTKYPREFEDLEAFVKWRNKHKHRGLNVKPKARLEIGENTLAYKLIEFLSVAVEYPYRSLGLFGNEKVYKRVVRQLTAIEFYKIDELQEVHTPILKTEGKGEYKFIRLHKNAKPVLAKLKLLYAYEKATGNYAFSGNEVRLEKKFRIVESMAMALKADFDVSPNKKIPLQTKIERNLLAVPTFYSYHELNKLRTEEQKTQLLTQITGVIFACGQAFTVYNTRDLIFNWQGLYEQRMFLYANHLARQNAGVKAINGAIVFVRNEANAVEFVQASLVNKQGRYALNTFYTQIHALPLDENGVKMLRILFIPDFHQKLKEYFKVGEKNISFLDGDVLRIMDARDKLLNGERQAVYCYTHQRAFLEKYYEGKAEIREVSIEVAEVVLDIQPDEFKKYEIERIMG